MIKTVTFDFTYLLISVGIIAILFLIALIVWACIATSECRQMESSRDYWRERYKADHDKHSKLVSKVSTLESELTDLKEKNESLFNDNLKMFYRIEYLNKLVKRYENSTKH